MMMMMMMVMSMPTTNVNSWGMRERRDECKREPWMCVGYRVDGRRVE